MIDAYGLNQTERLNIVDAIQENHDWLYSIIRSAADHGDADSLTIGASHASVGLTIGTGKTTNCSSKRRLCHRRMKMKLESPGANSPGDA